jgi:hypothetical protein
MKGGSGGKDSRQRRQLLPCTGALKKPWLCRAHLGDGRLVCDG